MHFPRGLRTFSAYMAVGGSSLLALAALNVAADRLPNATGLNRLRDYLVRRNG
jgi:hypothetical protein